MGNTFSIFIVQIVYRNRYVLVFCLIAFGGFDFLLCKMILDFMLKFIHRFETENGGRE